jgi:predicted MPP superfamily phosphohydrolase
LPIFGPVVEMTRFGDYYDMGLHRVENTWLYVNRGVGMEGGHVPRARFMCRPEIAVIELTSSVM